MAELSITDELILKCATDISALEQLYVLYKNKVFAYAYSILHDYSLAEDTLHEVFIRLHKSAKRFKGKSTAQTFILGITKNTAREMFRKQKYLLIQSTDVLTETADSFDFTQNVILSQMLDLLHKKQRKIVVLHIYVGLTFVEIANHLHTPVSTIKSRYQKALEILKNHIGDDYS